MKKILFYLMLALSVATTASMMTACGDDKEEPKKETPTDPTDPTATTDTVIVINGVKWATRNVDEPGTFAATPESAGKFYQWNKKVAWSATGSVSGWSDTAAAGTTWEKANDPSPVGWRVPTTEEQRTLLDAAKVTSEWTTQNGVSGRKFTDKTTNNSLFLPASGNWGNNGKLHGAGTSGCYWSSTQYNERNACSLDIISDVAGIYDAYRWVGFSVRAVAE
ncbi:MAG: hypothetical protein LBN27_01450 [Prevotellaceae bacterium]|jgi:uncharacterized protein (TIGR02145 family)|nr:hypothetical protein [Prevotellaceae bacterium]